MGIFNFSNDIIKAAQENNFQLIKEFSKTYNLNYRDKNGKSALFYAVENENYDMCKFLIDNGADIYIKDDRNLMAIHYAILINSNTIINLFMSLNFKYDIELIRKECEGISIKDHRKMLSIIKKLF